MNLNERYQKVVVELKETGQVSDHGGVFNDEVQQAQAGRVEDVDDPGDEAAHQAECVQLIALSDDIFAQYIYGYLGVNVIKHFLFVTRDCAK